MCDLGGTLFDVFRLYYDSHGKDMLSIDIKSRAQATPI